MRRRGLSVVTQAVLALAFLLAAGGAHAQAPSEAEAAPTTSAPAAGRTSKGGAVRLGGVVPLLDAYGSDGPGIALGLTGWYERSGFVLAPGLGLSWDEGEDDATFVEVPIDITVLWVPLQGFASPVIGVVGGYHFLYESHDVSMTNGGVLVTESQTHVGDGASGFAAGGQVGVMLFGGAALRALLALEYHVIFTELHESTNPQALTFGVSAVY